MENNEININKIIHEKLFGKCWHEEKNDTTIDRKMICKKCGKKVEFAFIQHVETWLYAPDYDSNISDAWKVVEEMERRGFNFMIAGAKGSEKYETFAMFGRLNGRLFQATAETLPLTICKACLIYLESEKLGES